LIDAHRDLDAAVAAAYNWQAHISEEDALANLLALNLARAALSEAQLAPAVKRKSRTITPEEARRSPQFKLPIAGGKAQVSPAEAVPMPSREVRPPRQRSRAKRRSA
jgi:hypothetical protein